MPIEIDNRDRTVYEAHNKEPIIKKEQTFIKYIIEYILWRNFYGKDNCV